MFLYQWQTNTVYRPQCFIWYFLGKISSILGWDQTNHVAKDDPDLLTFLFHFQVLGLQHAAPCWVHAVLGLAPRLPQVPGTPSTVAFPALARTLLFTRQLPRFMDWHGMKSPEQTSVPCIFGRNEDSCLKQPVSRPVYTHTHLACDPLSYNEI